MSDFQTLDPEVVARLRADASLWMTVRDVEDRTPVEVRVEPGEIPVVTLAEVAA